MITCIFIFFSRRNKIPILLTAIFIAWLLSYFPLIITVQSAKNGPGIVTACGIDRALIGYENSKNTLMKILAFFFQTFRLVGMQNIIGFGNVL